MQDFNFHLVAWPDVRVPGSDQDQEDRPSLIPRAFQERPGVCLAYLNTVIGNVFGKQSIQAATDAPVRGTTGCPDNLPAFRKFFFRETVDPLDPGHCQELARQAMPPDGR
ncbi:hypothetical protein EV702DRAFT_1049939 [Suillus placidus]|uniref:Uncharacterized protein n=1 Tax=Suillus placidus TaxID=48579 RepID=A0A9P7CWM7_9AGAM|nr:hypothetical protein EV702DRAFT_1049939 [Suillus placidus]